MPTLAPALRAILRVQLKMRRPVNQSTRQTRAKKAIAATNEVALTLLTMTSTK